MSTTRRSKRDNLLLRVDWPLLAILGALASIALVNLYSAGVAAGGVDYHVAQAVAFAMGLGVITVISLVDTRVLDRWSYVAYGGVIMLLAAVALFGTELNGSRRWINLGLFLLQPSELLKIGVILITARFFNDREREEAYGLSDLWRLFALVVLGVGFVLNQPDLGTSLTILAIFMTMVLFEGVRTQSLIALGAVIALSLPFGWAFGMKEYQKDRVRSFLSLEKDDYGQDWQVRQSIIAFGSGRSWGKGHLQGTQIQEGFVPEHENDFAAANWGEEHGFVGMLILLAVYMALIVWALKISSQSTDRFGSHIGVGIAAFIFWHVFVNLGMVTGVLPVVGLPLPIMSYGRSNLMTVMIGLGLLMNVSMRRKARQ